MVRQQLGSVKSSKGMSNWEAFTFITLIAGYFMVGMSLYEPLWTRWKIENVLEASMDDKPTLQGSPAEISLKIIKRMDVNGIYGISKKDFKIEKTNKIIRLTFNKEIVQPLAFNIDATVRISEIFEADIPI